MDLYRLLALSQDPQGCEGRLHINKLLEYSYPSIKTRLEDNGQKEAEMFFSRAELNKHFRPFVKDLLDCKCHNCNAAKQDVKDLYWVTIKKSLLESHPWILGFMIYLGKLHYIYYWMKWDFFDSRGDLKSGIMDDNRLQEKLIKPSLDRLIFKQAYLRAYSMFYPMAFEIHKNEPCPFRELPEPCRFPYLEKESISTDGFYGVMTKVQILPEYLNKNMIDLVTEEYPSSGTGAGRDRKFLFALKSVTTDPDSPLKSMERDILDMVSHIKKPAADNVITLLFAYNWKDQMHFLFPFIDMNLNHSIIQILGKGEDMTIPYSPGDSQYAAPESHPTLHYKKDGEGDIEVCLNYDVWSLGCIMVEVLIHLLDVETLEDFDKRLGNEQQAGFSTGTELKQCVNLSLKAFQSIFHNGARGQYMAAVTDLISRMLRHDMKDRPFSWDVFEDLEKQEVSLTALPIERDRITPAVKGHELRRGAGFKELGWHDGHSIVSFADKGGITVELVRQRDKHRKEPRPCRIRLFRKTPQPGQGQIEIAIIWGVERGGSVVVDERSYDLSVWRFSPTYLFRGETNSNERFECILFPIMESPGQRKSYDWTFIFEFETLQGKASIADMKAKKQRVWSKEQRQLPVFNKTTSHIQFWAEDNPKHYMPPALTFNGRKSTGVSISSSTPPTRTVTRAATGMVGQKTEKDFTTMVIFLQFESPLVIQLNDGNKVFRSSYSSEGKPCVTIVNRRGHESFTIRQITAQPSWKDQRLEEKSHGPSSILLEADYDKIPRVENKNHFKLVSMDIIIESLEDYDSFWQRTSKEWVS
ncbi:hypothetical protein HG531_013144 [Fusarium graminearum]|nr:hypothetical protein HG531_013144 [Fusarium graminearum]